MNTRAVFSARAIGSRFARHQFAGGFSNDRRLTDAMQRYWINFARTGDPNGAGLAEWPAYVPGDPQVMELGDRIGALPAPDHALCRRQSDSLYGLNGARP